MKLPMVPTDHTLLEEIYSRYYSDFASGYETRDAKPYMPIDIRSVAEKFGVHPELIFGQLNYHLQRRFGFENSDGSQAPFFAVKVGAQRHCVHFPMLAAALAEMRAEKSKHVWSLWLSILSLLVAGFALVFSAG